jgi:hypothetical protein
MSDQTTAHTSSSPRFSLDWLSLGRLSLDSWAVAAAVVFIALIVVGVFPRVPW